MMPIYLYSPHGRGRVQDPVPSKINLLPEEAITLIEAHGGQRAAARVTPYSLGMIQRRYRQAIAEGKAKPMPRGPKATRHAGEVDQGPVIGGQQDIRERKGRRIPPSGHGWVYRYILTCAQNNTNVNAGVWANLQALARHYEAEIMVSRFTYNKGAYGNKAVKPGTGKASDVQALWYDPLLAPYISDEQVQLAPGLVWCGEMNILPTANRPLAGLETYTQRESSIFPHVKLAMASVASANPDAAKLIYTTGTVTQRNYIQKKAGLKAEFHHCYGGLLVEVDHDGNWFVRQLNADKHGTIYDLTVRAKDGRVTLGHSVEAIVWGDIHVGVTDKAAARTAWSLGGMVGTLKPRFQVMHDVLDFRSRNHHDRKDPHKLFRRYKEQTQNVRVEVRRVGEFLTDTARPGCQTLVVSSNHDNALVKWLKEGDYRFDPVNAAYFLQLQEQTYGLISEGRSEYEIVPLAIYQQAPLIKNDVTFLAPDQSWLIKGIEIGMHGDRGPGGARGNANSFARMGRKAIVAHVHAAGITDGVYTVGTMSKLRLEWLRGPSAWSHTNCVIYPNGKRALLTMWNGKWRA